MTKSLFTRAAFTMAALLTLALTTVASSSLTHAANCQDLLDNHAYFCAVKRQDGVSFKDCLSFTSSGPDAFSVSSGGPQGSCSCRATGGFNNPDFDASKGFLCDDNGAFVGKVLARGNKMTGEVTLGGGSSFLVNCDLGCPAGAT